MEVSLAVLADYVVVSHDQKLSILGIFNNINGVLRLSKRTGSMRLRFGAWMPMEDRCSMRAGSS